MGLPGAGLRVGIIGTRSMASVHATPARTAGAEVRAIAGRTGRRYAVLPAGHPQGHQDAVTAFAADTCRAVRAARTTEAVLASARTGGRVEVDAAAAHHRIREMEHR